MSKIDLPIINYKECKERYGKFLDSEDVILTDLHICAGSKTWLLKLQEVCKVCFFESLIFDRNVGNEED